MASSAVNEPRATADNSSNKTAVVYIGLADCVRRQGHHALPSSLMSRRTFFVHGPHKPGFVAAVFAVADRRFLTQGATGFAIDRPHSHAVRLEQRHFLPA